ncbi:ATP-binding protein [Salmonirosea aquatica]|uniref:Transcriptional regulator n=1 Tax=Salmonirosea aquatica TaxID=2654236 RepID=A0A7C9FZR9_9BACT|nr:transcriptional regulator [Cytophagaceae bacterium SJW1-29]
MEQESQTIEWKESWRDEYLGWICGYANAKGGTLFIGKDDTGRVVGVVKAKKLLEDLPNKIRDVLGIMADVELRSENGLDYIAVIVEPYPYPVNYRGEYHYRTGSTKQVLKGTSLNKFLLNKSGLKWDTLPVPGVPIDDLDHVAFKLFRDSAARAKRLDERELAVSNEELLDALHLFDRDQLKRAAVLLFHSKPERFVTGAYVKIGFFGESATDLKFQDEVKGSLLRQVEGTMDLLTTKYMQAAIRYEGIQRVEEYPYPVKALREAVVNAIAHKDYSSGNPVQIRVFPARLEIYNQGHIPVEWSLEKFLGKHPSQPANPDIANTFFRAGFIEQWGRGIQLILTECEAHGIPRPSFNIHFDGLEIRFKDKSEVSPGVISKLFDIISDPVRVKKFFDEMERYAVHRKEFEKIGEGEIPELTSMARNLEPKSLKIITVLGNDVPMRRNEIMEGVELTNQTKNVKRYLDPLLNEGIVVPTVSDRPQSRLQKYILSDTGKKLALLLTEALIDMNSRLGH